MEVQDAVARKAHVVGVENSAVAYREDNVRCQSREDFPARRSSWLIKVGPFAAQRLSKLRKSAEPLGPGAGRQTVEYLPKQSLLLRLELA